MGVVIIVSIYRLCREGGVGVKKILLVPDSFKGTYCIYGLAND
jgi:hypothetical protein